MSKQSRARRKAMRDKMKKARRTANYLRFGPKENSASKKKKVKLVGGDGPTPLPVPAPRTSAKGRRRRRRNGLRWGIKK
jgi:hypothetical protein